MKKLKKFILEVGENIWKAVQQGWYPFLLVLILFPLPLHAQSERAQKQAKVIEKRQTSQRPTYTNPNNNQNRNYRPVRRVYQPYYYNPYIYGYTPYWNTNRHWDNREYIVSTDTQRTQTQKPPMRFSLGLLSEVTTQTPTYGTYLTIGRETFLMLQLQTSIPSSYPYYDNIYPWEVEEWEDEYIGTARDRSEVVIGAGKSIKRFSPFLGVGIGKETVTDTYRDETFILSPRREDGYYRINQTTQSLLSAKIGTVYGWEWFEGILQVSLGQEVRVGFGLGIKL